MPVTAEGRVEKPEEYVARICRETQGGYLVLIDEAGERVGNSGPLEWRKPNYDYNLVPYGKIPIVMTGTSFRWLRLLDRSLRDVGWRGANGDMMMSTSDKDEPILLSLTVYPPR